MTLEEKIARINELYRKSKAEGLTEDEKKEQDLLRKEYVANVRNNLRAQLDNIDVVNVYCLFVSSSLVSLSSLNSIIDL